MTAPHDGLISFVIPAYNESVNLPKLQAALTSTAEAAGYHYEIIYCDDGSTDNTAELVKGWHQADSRVRRVRLSRNFGKESALAAGIATARGQATIMLDSDGQHPVSAIPEFIAAWKDGAQVVIGISADRQWQGAFKRIGSSIFHRLFNRFSDQPLTPDSTDFRLIDNEVQQAFLGLKENNRITRGLIDWLGFKRSYVSFTTNARTHGTATYSRRKLIGLAANSFVSLTTTPMYLFGYLGIFITTASFVLGLAIIIEQLLLEDPLNWNFTGTAMLGVLIVFLVGIVLLSQGILSLYISHIHTQSKQRPLYVIDYGASAGLQKPSKAP